MRQTRSAKSKNATKMPQQVPGDDNLSSPPTSPSRETSPNPPSASFKGQLNKYCFKEEDKPPSSNHTPKPPLSPTSTNRTQTAAASPKARKKKKTKRTPTHYADPSQYAHLKPLVDILEPNLICIFVGTNPGVGTALAGHAYAHPSNLFWKLLHASGLTSQRLTPSHDRSLPARYSMGNTNLVARPSRHAAELSKHELAAGTPQLDEKIRKYRPEAVCIVGKGIWEAIWRSRYGCAMKRGEFAYGWQGVRHNMGVCGGNPYRNGGSEGDGKQGGEGGERNTADGTMSADDDNDDDNTAWQGARVYVTTSTSGLAAGLTPAQKLEIWTPFGEWVQQRRRARGFCGADCDVPINA